MELVIAPVEELRSRITHEFEALVGAQPLACALTGGRSAMVFLGALAHAQVDWSRVTLFWADERAVAPDHPDSNYGLARHLLLAPLGARLPRAFRMPADQADLGAAAMQYDQVLVRALRGGPLDLALVGVGEDGHVLSLFPGHRALIVDGQRVVAIEDAPKPPPRRLTLTLWFLVQTKRIWLVAVGPRKLGVLQQAIARTRNTTPLDLMMRNGKNVTVFTDQAIRREG
jgi:6-phosphogluconolactonase